ncbi:hypothetical protein Tco_1242027 [Tanacetum coccineum]
MKTTMSSDAKLTKDIECESVDSTKYRGMIGSLLYLMASGPDIMFSVCLCARFQEDPKTSILEAVKRIFHIGMDKSKITRKQSKSSKHGHENQKSTKKPSLSQSLSPFPFF